ncbi:hypothetical protein OnM2_018025 [Erysiphe neolycopersici]|uniref:Uncharacterized protein n=1 Tax=Erysiphe neolycopersici TaxID=212602 RepID=A0A420I4C9_9PEZI|nr:hypothetical protein OnM2_018025 [Erysiphe neolycopersici]
MSNYKRSTDGHTFVPTYPLQFSSECLNMKKSHEYRNSSTSNGNAIDFSSLTKFSNDLHNQTSSEFNHKLTSTNQRRSLQNTRLIPLKLGSAATLNEKKSIIRENETPPLATQRKLPLSSTPENCGLPNSEKEFKSIMSGVKLLYLRGNYKRCTIRCRMLLESIKDSFHIDPAYRVYLASYLASCLEIMAFELPYHSSAKLSLYQEALTHLQSATSELDYALFCTDAKVRNSLFSDASSQLSSARSSIDSVFSQCSKASSIASYSPLTEECTSNSSKKELVGSDCRRKKVSFSLPPHDEQDFPNNFDEDFQSVSTSSILDSFPIPMLGGSTCKRTSLEPAPLNLSGTRSLSPLFKVKSPELSKLSHLRLYQTLLSGFQSDFENRIKDIEKIIDEIIRNSTDIRDCCESKVELRKLRKKRIGSGWPRKRFDGSRYQLLCEKALIEL